jgi:hypothetical protein
MLLVEVFFVIVRGGDLFPNMDIPICLVPLELVQTPLPEKKWYPILGSQDIFSKKMIFLKSQL